MTRLNITFNDKAYGMIEKLQKMTGKSKAEVIRTALTLLDYAEKKKEEGESLAFVNKDKKIDQIVII